MSTEPPLSRASPLPQGEIMAVEFRSALRADAREIARLFQISSEGAADYIWSQLAQPGQDLLDVGASRYARDDVDFSWQNCLIAQAEGNVIGMQIGRASCRERV